MSIEKFAKLVGYKPKHISKGIPGDPFPVRVIFFRSWKGFSASIELGTKLDEKKGGCYFYFEVLDLNGYEDGDFIPLSSSRRHDVILAWPKDDEDYIKLAKKVKVALIKMHKKKKTA